MVPSPQPRISVITPTWQRHEALLERCIPSVKAQTWQNFEHVIVADGPDAELHDELLAERYTGYPVRWRTLDEHCDCLGEFPRLRALELAKGELIAYLDDDNAWRPQHLERLVAALEETGVDFAFSQMQRYGKTWSDVIGVPRPMYGQIDTSVIVHRKELLDRATWRTGYAIPGAPDWDLVERWLRAGATWTYVQEITVDYYMKG